MSITKLALSLIVSTIFSVILISTINYSARGEFSSMRSTVGHTFWAGVGMRENKFNVKADDGAVAEFYTSLTNKTNYENGMGLEYNKVLKEKAIEYVLDDPIQYSISVLYRSIQVLVPRQYVLFNTNFTTRRALSEIDALGAKYGKASLQFWTEVTQLYWWYPIWIIVRVALMLFLAVSLISILCFRIKDIKVLIVISPIFYTASVISLIYIKGVVINAAWTAALPAVLLGTVLLLNKFFKTGSRDVRIRE